MRILIFILSFTFVIAANASEAKLTGVIYLQANGFTASKVADLVVDTGIATYTAKGKVSRQSDLAIAKSHNNTHLVVIQSKTKLPKSGGQIFIHDSLKSKTITSKQDSDINKYINVYNVAFVLDNTNVVGRVACVENREFVVGNSNTGISAENLNSAACAFNLHASKTNSNALNDADVVVLLRFIVKKAYSELGQHFQR